MSDGEPGRMTDPPLSVPKIRFCNNGDEVRRGRAQMCDAAHLLDGAMDRSVLVERPMRPQLVIIGRNPAS
jgi:hypothetical protein